MSKYFTERHRKEISRGDKKHVYWIRELGYIEFDEIKRKVLAERKADKDATGLALVHEVVLAAVQEEDGTPSYTADEWRLEYKGVVLELGKEAMRIQGIDVDREPDPGETEPTAEEIEGNA